MDTIMENSIHLSNLEFQMKLNYLSICILHMYLSVSVSICIVLWIQSWIQFIHSSNLEFHMKLNNLSICIALSWSQSIHPSNLEFQMKLNNLSIYIHLYCICIHLYCTIMDTIMDTIYPNEIKQFIHLYPSTLNLYPSISLSICICIHLYLYLYPSVLYYHGYNLSIHQILWLFHHNTMDLYRNPGFHIF